MARRVIGLDKRVVLRWACTRTLFWMLAPSVLRFGSHFIPSFERGLACALQVLWLLSPPRSPYIRSPRLLCGYRCPFYLNFLSFVLLGFFLCGFIYPYRYGSLSHSSPALRSSHARPTFNALSFFSTSAIRSNLSIIEAKRMYPPDYSCYD